MLKNYFIRPYGVGKERRSLAMILPSEIVKTFELDSAALIFLVRAVDYNHLQITIIREKDIIQENNQTMIPAEKFEGLDQQVSSIMVG